MSTPLTKNTISKFFHVSPITVNGLINSVRKLLLPSRYLISCLLFKKYFLNKLELFSWFIGFGFCDIGVPNASKSAW